MPEPARRIVFECEILDDRPGYIQAVITGTGAKKLFQNEAGGHRWQRIPPTEKRGRVQTSTVTVAVLDAENEKGRDLNMKDVEITTARGSGPGGQHRNKTESCVVAVHRPSGIQVRVDMRSQHQSRNMALKILRARINELDASSAKNARDNERRSQMGTGMRGDKVRTYRTQDDQITDHRTGQKFRLSDWVRGNW
jgi:peptide chain release factor 1